MVETAQRPEKKVVEVPYGLGSSYEGFIEINCKLKGSLREKILAHELRHASGKYSAKDFKNDFQSKNPYFLESLWFSIKNPEALINFFPFMYSYYGRSFTYNSTSVFPFLYFGILYSIFFYIFFRISIFLSFFGWMVIFALINISLLIYTHIYVKKNYPTIVSA